MLTQLLRHGSLSYPGGFCKLATGQPGAAADLRAHGLKLT
jgi:hypothetical protein